MVSSGSVGDDVQVRGNIARNIIRKRHRVPLAFYRLKDIYVDVTTNHNFLDALLVIAAFAAFSSAFPFYPFAVLLILGIILFAFTLRHAFLGLIVLMIMIFPMLIYQTPALAYIFLMVMTLGLIFGYRHYRVFIFASILIPLALSNLGYLFVIPALVFGVLMTGYKRASVLCVIFVIGVIMLSTVTGVQNSAYISYNAQIAHTKVRDAPALNYSVPNKPRADIYTFFGGLGTVASNIGNQVIVEDMYSEFISLFEALIVQPLQYLIDIIVLITMVVFIDAAAVASRSEYAGTEASFIGIIYPLLYFGMSVAFKNPFSYLLPLIGFAIAPAALYILELYKVDIVKALDIRKEDLRLKFGEAFEDLFASSPTERFSDIGDYESIKMELKQALISPIEEKALSRAYNIMPAKGILLFGPPGTGKTLLMRAIANDIKAGFFLVKAPNLISAYPGDTERRLAKIFETAKKNSPCILFFDEIDSITRSRSKSNADEVHRQVLTQLLIELDGFQKLKNVVVVGATNVPNVMDPAVLRPGRFDRAIYMPLPDYNGRKEIFKIYLKKIPVSKNVKIDSLAKITERFSGADIKAVCENAAKEVAQEAATKHRVLEITNDDLVSFIKATKPSTTLAQLKEYEKFRMDFERRTLGQDRVEKVQNIKSSDIVGMEDAKKAIMDAVKTPLEHPELVKKYKIKAIKGVLMFGPPGCGKSMFMRSVANEMHDVTMLELDGAEIGSKGFESAESDIKEMFNRAIENAPSVLFIDEIDGIAPRRKDSSEERIQLTTELLKEMDGIEETKGVVVVCATNRPSALDPAMLRPGRFDKLVYVEPPNTSDREKLFKNYLNDVPTNEDIDFKELAAKTNRYTGADIANICREAKQNALDESIGSGKEVEITMENIKRIIGKFKPSAPDKLVNSYKAFLDRYGQR